MLPYLRAPVLSLLFPTTKPNGQAAVIGRCEQGPLRQGAMVDEGESGGVLMGYDKDRVMIQ